MPLTLIFALRSDDPERTRVGAGFADEQIESGRRRLHRRRRARRPAGVGRTAGAAVALVDVRVVQVVVVDGRLEGEVDGVRRRNRLHFRRRAVRPCQGREPICRAASTCTLPLESWAGSTHPLRPPPPLSIPGNLAPCSPPQVAADPESAAKRPRALQFTPGKVTTLIFFNFLPDL